MLKRKNPWRDVTVDNLLRPVRDLGSLTSREAYISGEDRDYMLDNKLQFELGSDYRFHFELPPEPWQGNPLTAKVIILTLNPGYVESANSVTAKLLKKATCYNNLLKFKNNVLNLEATSLMPEIKEEAEFGSDGITLFEAFNALGDWYWYKQFKELRHVLL